MDIIESKGESSDRNITLDRVAVLTFCKFMCVSQKFCIDNLDILFDLL